jgi:uncharacterized caspase-like protein
LRLVPPALRLALSALILSSFCALAQAPLDIRVALVIGNADYPGNRLLNPVNDARAMGDSLRHLGFTVVELHDASKVQLVDAIAKVRETLNGRQGVGLLYYAGHGLQLDWHNYMVPVNARMGSRADVTAQGVDIGSVIAAFKTAGNRVNILVLDACRDNPFSQVASGRGLAQPEEAPPGTFIAYSTAPGNVAEDGDAASGNGLYTHYLLQEIGRPVARIEDVFKRVRLGVRQQSQGRQVPWESTSLEADFFFDAASGQGATPEDLERQAAQARLREGQLLKQAADARARASANAIAIEQERQDAAAQARLTVRRPDTKALSAMDADGEQAFNRELADWDRVKETRQADALFAFLQKYPSGYMSQQAQFRLDQIQRTPVTVQAARDGIVALPSGVRRYRVGDVLSYERTDGLTGVKRAFKQRVTFADDDRAEINSGAIVLDQMGGVLKNNLGEKTPAMVIAPSDIAVGNSWRSAYVQHPSSGADFKVIFDSKVVALEEIDALGGKVKAYKVNRVRLSPNVVTLSTMWINPVTMHVVREELAERERGVLRRQYTLVMTAFKPAG